MKLNKKEFHGSKQPVALELVDINQTVTYKNLKIAIKHLNILLAIKGDDGIIRPLYIILPQMSGYTKPFDNDRKKICVL